MRIFKNKEFHRWAKTVKVSDSKLKKAVKEIGDGLYEANLGGNIFKKRIAMDGRGKSAGARAIIAFKIHKRAFFIYGYAKNVCSNISDQEQIALKKLARIYFSFSEEQIHQAVRLGELIEVV